MSSCKSIIVLALSKLGVAGGAKAPRDTDLALGLITLQSLFRSLITNGTLGRARTVVPKDTYIAGENERIFRTNNQVGGISLPITIMDRHFTGDDERADYGLGTSCTSYERPPRNGSFVVINDAITGNTVEYIYDGYTNLWVSIGDLTLDDNTVVTDASGNPIQYKTSSAPLSANSNGLAALLATYLADHYSAKIEAATVRDAQEFTASLSQGFAEPARRGPGFYF